VPVGLAAHTVRSPGIVSVGGRGLISIISPIEFETQPLSVTLIFVYEPDERLLISIVPEVDEVLDTGVIGTPFLA